MSVLRAVFRHRGAPEWSGEPSWRARLDAWIRQWSAGGAPWRAWCDASIRNGHTLVGVHIRGPGGLARSWGFRAPAAPNAAVAEAMALEQTLALLEGLGAERAHVFTDCQGLAVLAHGEQAAHGAALDAWVRRIRRRAARFARLRVRWIPRGQNWLAHTLACQAARRASHAAST